MNCDKCGKPLDGPTWNLEAVFIEHFEETGAPATREIKAKTLAKLCQKCCPVKHPGKPK